MRPAITTMAGSKHKSRIPYPLEFLDKFDRVKSNGQNQWLASCPCGAHKRGDVNPSLSIRFEDGKILLHCFAGCSLDDICSALGFELSDLFFDGSEPPATSYSKPVIRQKVAVALCTAKPFSDPLHSKVWRRLEQLEKAPLAVAVRGFNVNDCKALGIASSGHNAVLSITNPWGSIVAFKLRYYIVPNGKDRYYYLTTKAGSPAWCSPCFFTAEKILIVEGELNAMACAVARRNMDEDVAFMGIAGIHGQLWFESLRGKIVYCYADGDEAGQAAKERWARAAAEAGASEVFKLKPLPDLMDFCDLLATRGRNFLREELLQCLS